MNETLKNRLAELGFTAEQVEKLASEGVVSEADLTVLTASEIREVAKCGIVLAKKAVAAFAAPAVPAEVPAEPAIVSDEALVGVPAAPKPAEVKAFATGLGIDPTTLTMFLMGGGMAGGGMEFDMSSMIPVSQIVPGYNPKIKDIAYLVMGQIERRLDTPIVVINANGSVNVALTVEYIMGLEEGRDVAEDNVYFDSEGTPYEIISVGVDAQSVYDADPLVPTKALPINNLGTGRVNWTGVGLEARQVAFYASTQTHEIDPGNDAHLSWLRDHVKPGVSRLVFQGQAPGAIKAYNAAARTGSLPTLRVMLSRSPRRREFMPRRRSGSPKDLTGLGKGEVGLDEGKRF